MAQPALDENKIRETAYLFWLDEGRPAGRDEAHWHMAVDALTPATPKTSARKAPAKKAAAKAAPKAKSTAKPKTTVKSAAKGK